MEEFKAEINTLCTLLPQNVPFVMQQVSEAVRLCVDAPNTKKNLDVAIKVAEQITKYSSGEMLYNYTPVLVALLKEVEDAEDIAKFDTVDHAILIGIAQVKNFVDTYATKVKNATVALSEMKEDLVMVAFANMLEDLAEGKNTLAIAYIILSLSASHVQYVNGTFKFYCDLLGGIGKAEF